MPPGKDWPIWQAWNWKSALLSALFRAPIFVITGFRAGWESIAGAVIAEGVFRIVASGFYGAVAQYLTRMRERWKQILVLLILLPVVEQTLDYFIHSLRGTANLRWAMITSCIVMAVSAMFNWYAMTQGALRTDSGRSFGADLRSMPAILLKFLLAAPLALKRSVSRASL